MDQDIGSEVQADPAAVAFEALRREVALLNVALAGLAAERAPAPDYSETLGEIAQGVRVAVGRIGKLATSPALAVTPAEIARQITAAGQEARRQDHAVLHQTLDGLQRTARELRGWIESAKLASHQNWQLLQTAMAGLAGGAILGVSLPSAVAKMAPEHWAWPEKRAAGLLHRDMWSAGERMLFIANPQKWQQDEIERRTVAQNRETLRRCLRASHRTKSATSCSIKVDAAKSL